VRIRKSQRKKGILGKKNVRESRDRGRKKRVSNHQGAKEKLRTETPWAKGEVPSARRGDGGSINARYTAVVGRMAISS